MAENTKIEWAHHTPHVGRVPGGDAMIRVSFVNTNVAVPNYPMAALTLWQPWASLIVHGLKEYETRGWQPSPNRLKIGDPIVIHAAKREPERIAELWQYVKLITPTWGDLPTGCVLGYGYFQGVRPIHKFTDWPSRQERALGDWSPGRQAWRITDLHVFAKPIPVTGKQGLWEWKP